MVIVFENIQPMPQPEVWGPIKDVLKNGIVAEANALFPTNSTALQEAKNRGSWMRAITNAETIIGNLSFCKEFSLSIPMLIIEPLTLPIIYPS